MRADTRIIRENTLEDWELRDANNANFHALIKTATVDEISITDRPCNPPALVRHQFCAPPAMSFEALMQKRVNCLVKMVRRGENIQRSARKD